MHSVLVSSRMQPFSLCGMHRDDIQFLCVECTACDYPRVVNEELTTCSPCSSGFGPSANRSQCISCGGHNYSVTGVCQHCAAPNVVDPNHQTCTACLPGFQPNAKRSDCVACNVTTYSSLGVECTACDFPRVITFDSHRACCSPGTAPDAIKRIATCVMEPRSPFGAGAASVNTFVVNEQRTSCSLSTRSWTG